MAARDHGDDPPASAPLQLRVLTDLPPLPQVEIPDLDAGIAGEGGASEQHLEQPVDGDSIELAELAVDALDGAIAWVAYGPESERAAPPAAKRRVAGALVRLGGRLPGGDVAAAVMPAWAVDAGTLLIFSALAWGAPLLIILERWRDRRAENRQADYGDGTAGGADRAGGVGPYPGGYAGTAAPGGPGAQAGPYGPDFDPAEYGARLAAAAAGPGGTIRTGR